MRDRAEMLVEYTLKNSEMLRRFSSTCCSRPQRKKRKGDHAWTEL